MLGQKVLNPIGAELSTPGIGENDIVFRSSPFSEPCFHDSDGLFGERRAALFASLAIATDMSP